MKKGNGMLWVFILNLTFSMLELMGGVLTGSTAILSDWVHDLGDAVSVGVAYAFERKSKKAPDERYTYGYARYSAVGGLVTVTVLLLGSLVAVGNAIYRLINPAEIDHGGMIALAVVGLCVNLFSACNNAGNAAVFVIKEFRYFAVIPYFAAVFLDNIQHHAQCLVCCVVVLRKLRNQWICFNLLRPG